MDTRWQILIIYSTAAGIIACFDTSVYLNERAVGGIVFIVPILLVYRISFSSRNSCLLQDADMISLQRIL